MKFTAVGVLLVFLVLAQKAEAQDASALAGEAQNKPSPLNFETLTLDQAVTYALSHSPQIQQAQLTVSLAELDLERTRFWKRLIPSLAVHHGYNSAVEESRVGIGLSLDLNRIWEENTKAKQAKLQWFNADIYRKTIQSRIIVSVTRDYYDFITAKKQVQILEDQLQTQLKLQEIQRMQFESGQTQLSQLLNTLHTVATTQLAFLKAHAQVNLQQLQLKQTIGFPLQ